jgi:hypothetical protein
MTPDEFRSIGHRLIDWIADYRENLAQRPVMAQTAPGQVKDQFPSLPPEQPEGFDGVFSASLGCPGKRPPPSGSRRASENTLKLCGA